MEVLGAGVWEKQREKRVDFGIDLERKEGENGGNLYRVIGKVV